MSESKESSAKATPVKTKKMSFENAFIVPAELGEQIYASIGELPIKYSQVWGPIGEALQQCNRGNIELEVPDVETPKK